jgi:UDP-N-acetylmuramate--alanine ligase
MQRLVNLRNYGISARFHIIGIGGIGMSGIADILKNMGYQVQGSDMQASSNTQRLESLGLKIYIGHSPENLYFADYVVISSSIKPDNPEYKEALDRKIPIIRRSEMLAEIMRMKTCVSISGSHGKTSTTSMVASVFEAAGLQPTVINGGIINTKSTNAYSGSGEYMVVEADESDATFIKIPSSIGVITNIDPEHLDFYGSFENLMNAFRSFIQNLPFYGFAVLCLDHDNTRKLASEIIDKKIITYGIKSKDANVMAYNIRSSISGSIFDVKINLPHSNVSYVLENIALNIPGEHNVLNCLAAISIGAELDFGIRSIKEGLARFGGVKRRFTLTHQINGVRFVDDYAHHPAEITVTLSTAKSVINSGDKLTAIFQPHRYSRLSNLFEDFVNSFEQADEILIAPVYAAGEDKIEDFDSKKLANKIAEKYTNKKVLVFDDPQELKVLLSGKNSGDIVLFMGAGSITKWAYDLPEQILWQK